MVKKVQISIDDELLERIDEYADKHYMSRSGFFTLVSTQQLAQEDVLKAMNKLTLAIERISITNKLEEKDMLELKAYQQVLDTMIGKQK